MKRKKISQPVLIFLIVIGLLIINHFTTSSGFNKSIFEVEDNIIKEKQSSTGLLAAIIPRELYQDQGSCSANVCGAPFLKTDSYGCDIWHSSSSSGEWNDRNHWDNGMYQCKEDEADAACAKLYETGVYIPFSACGIKYADYYKSNFCKSKNIEITCGGLSPSPTLKIGEFSKSICNKFRYETFCSNCPDPSAGELDDITIEEYQKTIEGHICTEHIVTDSASNSPNNPGYNIQGRLFCCSLDPDYIFYSQQSKEINVMGRSAVSAGEEFIQTFDIDLFDIKSGSEVFITFTVEGISEEEELVVQENFVFNFFKDELNSVEMGVSE